jgi:hypothetical protein
MNLNVDPSNLAGLTPENIMAVVGARQNQDQLRMQSYRDLVDSMYKGSVMQREAENAPVERALKQAQTKKAISEAEKENALDKPFTINALKKSEGTTLREWNALPKDEQDYQMFLFGEKQTLGTGPELSRQEFKELTPTERDRFFNRFMRDPKFKAAALEYAKAGATTIGEVVGKAKAISELQGEDFFKDPKSVAELDRYMSSREVKERIEDFRPEYPPNATKEQKNKIYRDQVRIRTAKEKANAIEARIAGGGGVVLQDPIVSPDRTHVTWKVKWPSGTIESIIRRIQ